MFTLDLGQVSNITNIINGNGGGGGNLAYLVKNKLRNISGVNPSLVRYLLNFMIKIQ